MTALGRRDILIVGTMGLTGCAILRGGTHHPVYEKTATTFEAGVFRIPLSDLSVSEGDRVLELKPGKPYPDVLVTPGPKGFLVALAHCTHKGCVLDFASSKQEWKCDCHGSRFSLDGSVLEGPASEALPIPPSHIEGDRLIIDLNALARA